MKKLSVFFTMFALCILFGISVFAQTDIYRDYREIENVDLQISNIVATSGGNIIKTKLADGKNYLFLPSSFDETSMWLNFNSKAEEVWVYRDGFYIIDIKNAKSFNLKNTAVFDKENEAFVLHLRALIADNENKVVEYSTFDLYIMKSANIGAMFINFDNSEYGRQWVDSSPDHTNDSATYTKVNMCMINESGKEVYNNSLSRFKGRGNTTWRVDKKKPYRIKLNKKTDLLESGNSANKNKTWVLVANSLDMTMFRNAMALDLARYLGLKESPEHRFVDLYFDGIYHGTYLLCEKVRINSGRIEIKDGEDFTSVNDDNATERIKNKFGLKVRYNPTATSTEKPENIGYLLERDISNYALQENSWFINPGGSYVVIKSPECATKERALYISELYAEMWYAAKNGEYNKIDVSEYIDIDSFASICLLNEYLLNIDYITSSSYFFLPERGNENYEYKFYAGPAWDFDGSMGARRDNETMLDPSYVRWFGKTYFSSEKVQKAIQEKAENIYNLKDIIFSFTPQESSMFGIKSMSYYKDILSSTQKMNYKVNSLAQFVLYKNFDSYEEGYDYTYDFMIQRHEIVLNAICRPCSCNCHKSGFMGFIWKIQCFFRRIFSPSKKMCACGVKHW